MLLVLGQGYQGVVTSFMTDKYHYNKLKTFSELMQSNYKLLVGGHFENLLSDNEEYKLAEAAGKVVKSLENTDIDNYEELAGQNLVLFMTCDHAEYYMSDASVTKYYYMLEEKLFSYYTELDAGIRNPFIRRIQDIMNRCFEAGLQQIWKVFLNITKSVHSYDDDFEVLGLEEIYPIFIFLLIGHSLALIAFLFEIFYHDFVSKLSLSYCTKKIRERINKMARKDKKKGSHYYIMHKNMKLKRLQHGKLKVRKIRVRPINIE